MAAVNATSPLDTASDALTAAAVAATGAIICANHGAYWLDPVVAIIIGLLIAYGALRLLSDVVTSLRTHNPSTPMTAR